MFSVIFEVHPRPERFDLYLGLAKELKPILEGIDGFIDNERFESTRRPGWILSHSTWRDEKSVVRWRTVAKHHDTQQRGRRSRGRRRVDFFTRHHRPSDACGLLASASVAIFAGFRSKGVGRLTGLD